MSNQVNEEKKQGQAWVMEDSEYTPGSGKNLVDADFARQAADYAAGNEEQTYGFMGFIYRVMKKISPEKKKYTFKKKTYLWLMLFTGWCGGHRLYQGRRVLGVIELLLFWTGIPLLMCVTDLMEVIPVKADEGGFITM